MRKYLIVCLSALFSQIIVKAQDRSDYRQKFTEGNLLILEGNYVQALKNFLWAYNIDSTNANINYKIGLCYLKTITERRKALSYLEKAVSNTTKKYNDIEPTEKQAPVTAFFYYGQALHLNYRFDEAIANYEKFKSLLYSNQTDLLKDVNRSIEISNNAKMLVAAPIKVNITNLGDSINSPFPDYSAVISADEKTLIFTSRRPGSTGGDKTIEDEFYEDIYISYRKPDSTWTTPVSISPNINTVTHEASVGLTADAQTLLIYKDMNGGDIYYSTLDVSDQWSIPQPIGSNVNTSSWETSACLTPDGNTLYFVSNRKGGLGGRDIWKCVKLPNGKWSLAVNLGAPINTPYDEESPFIHPSGNLLFFSSNGHNTIGGFDIFFSNAGDNGWETPINIGYPINTPDDDLFYVTSPDGKRGYYSSSSRPEGYGEKDIYMISIPERKEEPLVLIRGKIKGKIDSDMSNLGIIATNNVTGAVVGTYRPLKDGSFTIIIPPGSNYTLSYQDDGTEFYSESIEVPPGAAYQEIEKAVNLKDVNVPQPKDSLAIHTGTPITGHPDDKNLVLERMTKPAGSKPGEDKKEKADTGTSQPGESKNEKEKKAKEKEQLASVDKLNFEMHFKYNITETDVNDTPFKEFVDHIMELYKRKGTISLTITSSASYVPTKSFGGNKELSQVRNNKIRDQLKKALKDKGVSEDKIVVTKVKTVVAGPAYKNDYLTNKAEYEKYQYVKVAAN
jgi:tetratricopeptide (TPR) repeat protein